MFSLEQHPLKGVKEFHSHLNECFRYGEISVLPNVRGFFEGALNSLVLQCPAKSLGTLAMIYATDELQNPPPPLKTMLCEGDMNNPVRRSDAFLYN